MSDNDSGGLTNRLAPKRGRVTLDDLTLIVRPPGRHPNLHRRRNRRSHCLRDSKQRRG